MMLRSRDWAPWLPCCIWNPRGARGRGTDGGPTFTGLVPRPWRGSRPRIVCGKVMAQRLSSKDDAAGRDPLAGLTGRVVRRFLVVDVGAEDGEVTLPSGARGRLVGSFHSADLAFALAESERGQGRRALVYDLRQLRSQAARQRVMSSIPQAQEQGERSGRRSVSMVSRRDVEVPSRPQTRSTARPRRPGGSKRD